MLCVYHETLMSHMYPYLCDLSIEPVCSNRRTLGTLGTGTLPQRPGKKEEKKEEKNEESQGGTFAHPKSLYLVPNPNCDFKIMLQFAL